MNSTPNILALADRCVKCGLCLPQCPTYELTRNENESPRGRIALIQGWLSGQLSATENLTRHLDQCLHCRRCERICPSLVPYGEIMDQASQLRYEKIKFAFSLQNFIRHASLKLLLNKSLSGYLISSVRLLQKTGLIFLARKSGILKLVGIHRLVSFLPELSPAIQPKNYYPATLPDPSIPAGRPSQSNVALFTGCISNQLDPETVKASIRLLNRLGYGVYVPQQQVCCGALHLHEGNNKHATQLANTNIKLFNQQNNITAVVSLVNGCTSQLREYSLLDTDEKFTPAVKDIVEFLAEIEWPEKIKFEPLNKSLALQVPCSLQNVLRAEDKLLALLSRIPGMKLPPESIYQHCCGAAGTYFLRHPQLADQFREQALSHLNRSTPTYIISSNIGCALQLKSGLTLKKSQTKVIHPIVLLDMQLKSG